MTEWFARAACRGIDPARFVPSEERSSEHWRTVNKTLDNAENKALAELKPQFCDWCSCWSDCLLWAVEHGELGVWAGTTTKERRFLRNPREARRSA